MNKGFNWETNNLTEFEGVAREIFNILKQSNMSTVVIGLSGNLGAGKTTLSKIIAKHLGVVNEVVSPTFNIMKIYQTTDSLFKIFIHIDAYRITTADEAESLNKNLKLHDDTGGYFTLPNTLVFIEWPENIKNILPKTISYIEISHDGQNPEKRHISLH